jgi:hypothetical protein
MCIGASPHFFNSRFRFHFSGPSSVDGSVERPRSDSHF